MNIGSGLPNEYPNELEPFLGKYESIFKKIIGFPLSRAQDHRIHLEEGTFPVNKAI